jgi:hypothetical protein
MAIDLSLNNYLRVRAAWTARVGRNSPRRAQ